MSPLRCAWLPPQFLTQFHRRFPSHNTSSALPAAFLTASLGFPGFPIGSHLLVRASASHRDEQLREVTERYSHVPVPLPPVLFGFRLSLDHLIPVIWHC